MTDPKSKKAEELSVGALTYCRELAKQIVYGYSPQISSKYIEKGLIVESQSIALYNEVFFCDLKKNIERRHNQWLTGEADIVLPEKTLDLKSSWSLQTFPATVEDADNTEYEWQGRGYMMLWNKPVHEVAYCMVSTPDELIGFEDSSIHYVDEIHPELRITRIHYERDKVLEDKIICKAELAQKQIALEVERIKDEHKAA